MIEKILERLEARKDSAGKMMKISDSMEEMDYYYALINAYNEVEEIVQELAKEYDEFDVIYKKVCELEKEYAEGGDFENVNRCIRLQNLLQYFKELLIAPYQKGE